MMKLSCKPWTVLLCLASLGICLSGCSASSKSSPDFNPYKAEFAQIMEQTRSDYVRKVLANGEISAAEFRETLDSEIKCMKDGGVDAIIDQSNSGVGFIAYPSSQESLPAVLECENQWDGGIVQLYRSIVENPNNVPFVDLQAACLVKMGLAPKGFQGKDLQELHDLASEQTEYREDGTIVSQKPIVNPTPNLPNSVPLYSEQTEDCLNKPWLTTQN
jgi:hypothetical protein